MKKDHFASESAFFNPRIFAAFVLCSVGVWLAMFSFASTPSTGSLSDTGTTVLTYDAGPFLVANQSPVGLGQVDSGPRCDSPGFECDTYTLNTNISSTYLSTHGNASIKVTMFWSDLGAGQ